MSEISALIRQITASVTFLPLLGQDRLSAQTGAVCACVRAKYETGCAALSCPEQWGVPGLPCPCAWGSAADEPCTFDLLVYADNDMEVPVVANSTHARTRARTHAHVSRDVVVVVVVCVCVCVCVCAGGGACVFRVTWA